MTRFWRLAFVAAIVIAKLGLLYLVAQLALAIEQLDLWQQPRKVILPVLASPQRGSTSKRTRSAQAESRHANAVLHSIQPVSAGGRGNVSFANQSLAGEAGFRKVSGRLS